MKRMDATLFFYLSIETKQSYRAKSGRFELPSLAGLKATFRRMGQAIGRQLETALTGAILGQAAWGVG
jgi:hypothetical protein